MERFWHQMMMIVLLRVSDSTTNPQASVQSSVYGRKPSYYSSRPEPDIQTSSWPRLNTYRLPTDRTLYHGKKDPLLSVDPPPGVSMEEDGAYYEYNIHDPGRKIGVKEQTKIPLHGNLPDYEFFPVAFDREMSVEVPVVITNFHVLRPQEKVEFARVTGKTPSQELRPFKYIAEDPSPPFIHEQSRSILPTPSSPYQNGRYNPFPLPQESNRPSSAGRESSDVYQPTYENGASRSTSPEKAVRDEYPENLNEAYESMEFRSLPRKLQDDIKLIEEFIHATLPVENQRNH